MPPSNNDDRRSRSFYFFFSSGRLKGRIRVRLRRMDAVSLFSPLNHGDCGGGGDEDGDGGY